MKKVKVLIVDDSVVFRSQIRSALESVEWIEVLGVAANGRIALDKMKIAAPDLVTLDLEMPVLSGIETLKEMKALGFKAKVIVFSSVSKTGAQITMDALGLGAADFVPKPNGDNHKSLGDLLIPRISSLFQVYSDPNKTPQKISTFNWHKFKPEAILIGSSTGGPTALEKIFSQIRGPINCPIFIAQHMPPIFTASLAQRLGKICGVPADEGKHGEIVQNNRIYMAPGNYHMQILKEFGVLKISLNQQELENSVRPAVDQLFRSASQIFQGNALGIVLTGMGKDGLLGAQNLKDQKNPIIIQNKESCIVFGMPGAIYEFGCYDSIQDLDHISQTLNTYTQPNIKKDAG